MSSKTNPSPKADDFFLTVGQASSSHWGLAVKAALEALGPLPESANIGFVYVTQGFADDLSSIVTFLRETTPVSHWVGAAGYGVMGPDGELRDGSGITLMAGQLPAAGLRPFDGFTPDRPENFLAEHGDWLSEQQSVCGVVHGNPRDLLVAPMLGGLAETANAYLVGGLTLSAETPVQVAGRITESPLTGVLFGDAVPLAVGITQGCHPIGPLHRVTEVVDNVVMGLDGRPALEVLKEEAGEIIARNLSKAAGYIHIALPLEGSDNIHDYAVRNLLGIDPRRGWLAVGERMLAGERLMFVRRDANSAQQDMHRMLDGLKTRLAGRVPKGGLYIACMARGATMFGRDGREAEMIREVLGEFPLIGFSAAGEVCHDRLYGYTGVLALFL